MISDARSCLSIGLPGRALAALAGTLLLLCSLAAAQDTGPNPPAREAAPAHQPGMLEGVGRWFKDSYNRLSSNVEGARDSISSFGERAGSAAKDAAAAARDAAGAVAKLPNSRIVETRERCAVAANGAPDCQSAAESVCKGKGYATGSSFEIQSAQKCSARTWLSGRPDRSACDMESFVTRALCQ